MNITEAKRAFLEIIARVEAGETFAIVHGRTGELRAVLEPVPRRRRRLQEGREGRPSPPAAAPDVGAGTGEVT